MIQNSESSAEKIIETTNLLQLENIKDKKVLIGGCFDILHYGHLTFLQKAKETGKVLIILLESDDFIKKYKRRKPIHNQEQRAVILSNLTIVDYIVKLPIMTGNDSYLKLVQAIKPDIIAVTQGDSKIELKKEQAEKVGAKLQEVTLQLPFSSSTYAPLFRD